MSATPLFRWLSSLGADALGRFSLQLVSTVIFARLLAAEDFGQAALTMAIVGVLSILVTAPFEEGLVQKRVVRKAHFSACLGILLVVAAGLWMLGFMTTRVLSFDSDNARLVAGLVAIYSLILFADAPVTIFTALARRHRRFGVIAAGNFVGLAMGTAVGLLLAFNGVGVWSLLIVRLLARYVCAVWIALGAGFLVLPRWMPKRLTELSGFARWYFADRATTAVCEALFQSLVTGLLGIAANGYLNMAMRIVEPVRGAAGAISHNLSMSFFARLQDSPERMRQALRTSVRQTSLLLLPVFCGLAAVSDTLIVLLAGEQWSQAVPIAVCLALAAALISPTSFIHSATTARGRAELGFATSLCGLLLMAGSISLLAPLGLIAIGLSRLVYYAGDAVWGVGLARYLFRIRPRQLASDLAATVTASASMALLVVCLPAWLPDWPLLPVLVIQVAAGALVYLALILLLARKLLRDTIGQLVHPRAA